MTKFYKKFNRSRSIASKVCSIDLFFFHRSMFCSMGKALSNVADKVTDLYGSSLDNKDYLDDISAIQESIRDTYLEFYSAFKQRTATIITALLCISIAQAAMLFILLFV